MQSAKKTERVRGKKSRRQEFYCHRRKEGRDHKDELQNCASVEKVLFNAVAAGQQANADMAKEL